MATENRADCDNARHRPATETPTPIKSSANSLATSVQVEKLSARCRRTARKPIRNPCSTDNSILLCVNSPTGRRCGHLLQEGGREVGHSMLLMFVDSSSTITCKGSGLPCLTRCQAVSSLAQKVAVHLLTIGRCGDCLVWDVDEACRIRQSVW